MQQPRNMDGTQMIVVTQAAPLDTQSRYRNMSSEIAERMKRFGRAHIVFGASCIFSQIVSFVFARFNVGHGLWTGSLFVVTGVFGIFAGKTGGKCQVITFHVLSTVSAGFAAILFSIAVFYLSGLSYASTSIVMEGTMALISLAEGAIAIYSSITCCALGICCCDCGGSCCCPTDPQYQQFVNPDQPDFAQQQFLTDNQQRPMFNPNQQQLMFNPNQQQTMLIQEQQQPMFNLSQQQLLFNPTQPMIGFISQQFAAQSNDHQPSVLPNTAQPVLSTETTGQGAHATEYIGTTAGPLPTDTSTEPSGESSNECLIRFSNSDSYPSQESSPPYDSDSELISDI